MVDNLTTTWDVPSKDWTINPIRPSDLANWQLVGVTVAFDSNAGYALVYPDSSAGSNNYAQLTSASFIDSTGRQFFTGGHPFQPICFTGASPYAGLWVCSDGDILGEGKSFGTALFGGPPDPNLPSLDRPITLHLAWTVNTSQPPLSSDLFLNGAFFSYVYAPVPEPSTALLLAAGIVGLALRRRRARGTSRGERASIVPPLLAGHLKTSGRVRH